MIQLTLTLKMTTAQVLEPSLTINNSSIQDYVHADDHSQPTYEVSSEITAIGSVILIIIINVTLTKSIMLIFLISFLPSSLINQHHSTSQSQSSPQYYSSFSSLSSTPIFIIGFVLPSLSSLSLSP